MRAEQWRATGNLIGNNDECRWNTPRFASGAACHTYADARQVLAGMRVTEITIVVGGGFAFEDQVQTLVIRNVWVNGRRLFAPLTPAVACRAQRTAMGPAAFALHYRDTPTSFARCQGSSSGGSGTARRRRSTARR